MRVMVIVKATQSSETGQLPSEELLTEMGRFNEELVNAGIMKMGEGLKPTSAAKRVRFEGQQRIVTDGPFAATNELVAGYWIWEVASMHDAVEWVKKCPNPMPETSEIEIRPIYEMSDFAESDPKGEVAAQESRLTREIAMQGASVAPYLFFGGRCEEAMAFYERAIGARVVMKMRFDESPHPTPPGMLAPGFETKIMHATLAIGAMNVMVSDGCDERSHFDGFRLALTLPTDEACRAAFDGLAEEGKVEMPLTPTFWSPLYGMLTDRFGVEWMVMAKGPDA